MAQLWAEQSSASHETLLSASPCLLVHELRRHQAELERQNEALKRAQIELDSVRARYFELYERAPVGYCTVSDPGIVEQANLKACELLGVSRETLIGQPLCSFILSNDQDCHRQFRKALLDSGGPQTCELRIAKNGGTSVWVHLSATLAEHSTTAGGREVRLVLTDITEHHQVLAALSESEERYRSAFQLSPDSVTITRFSDGTYQDVNDGFEHSFGWTRAEVVGKTSEEIGIWKNPADRQLLLEALKRNGYCKNLEVDLMTREGKVITSQISSRRIAVKGTPCLFSITRDINERKRLEDQARQMAFHDTLTQLPNRRLLVDRLGQTLAASARTGFYGAIMFLDLDDFKPLNDAHGHDVGDLLLLEVSERLKHCVRETDTVTRFGGDEFVVMINELAKDKAQSTAEAEIIAEKIRHRLAEPYRLAIANAAWPGKTVEHRCSASIGVVLFLNHEATQETILKSADIAMYQAKESGRNQVRFIDLSPSSES